MAITINADNGIVSGTSGLKYLPDNSGVIQFQTSGVSTMTIDTSRNVVMANSANVTGVLNTANVNTTGALFVNGAVTFANSTANNFIVNSNGNISVVTPSPAWYSSFYTLNVGKGTLCGTGGNFAQLTTNIYYDGSNYLRQANGYGSRVVLDGDNGGIYFDVGANGGIGNTISFYSNTGAYLAPNGHFGIGTSTPTNKLTITDGATPYSWFEGTFLDIKRNVSNGNNTTSRVGLRLANQTNGFSIFYGGTSDRLRFIDGGETEILSLVNGGNVGIGTIAPGYTLEVQKAINSTWLSRLYNTSANGYGVLVRSDATVAANTITLAAYANASYQFVSLSNGTAGIGTPTVKAPLHVKTGGIMFNGMASNSSSTYDNYWTAFICGGASGTFSGTLTITIPDVNGGAGSVGYGGWSAEVYVAGYSGMFCHYFCSGYVNQTLTSSESSIRNSGGGSWACSHTINGQQGVTITIDYPSSIIHPTAYVRFNKAGDPASDRWTDISAARMTWS